MDMSQDITKIKEAVDKAKDILIVTHGKPTYDSMGSALAMYVGLTTLEKKVTVASPAPMTVEFSDFVGANKLTNTFTKRNFIISLDSPEGAIEKVSYNLDGGRFNLIIEPRAGFDTLSEDRVHYSRGGAAADLVIVIDCMHLGELGALYESEKEAYAGKPIINIDRHEGNARFGMVNVVDPKASATAELVAFVLSSIGVKLNEDIATNILNALYGATRDFTGAGVTARTFEIAAVCMKGGGKRFFRREPKPVEPRQPQQPAVVEQRRDTPHVPSQATQPTPAPKPSVTDQPKPANGDAPEDWLKPKIFKTSGGTDRN